MNGPVAFSWEESSKKILHKDNTPKNKNGESGPYNYVANHLFHQHPQQLLQVLHSSLKCRKLEL